VGGLVDAPDVLLDLGDVVLERLLREPEVVIVEQALRIAAQPEDELRDEFEVIRSEFYRDHRRPTPHGTVGPHRIKPFGAGYLRLFPRTQSP